MRSSKKMLPGKMPHTILRAPLIQWSHLKLHHASAIFLIYIRTCTAQWWILKYLTLVETVETVKVVKTVETKETVETVTLWRQWECGDCLGCRGCKLVGKIRGENTGPNLENLFIENLVPKLMEKSVEKSFITFAPFSHLRLVSGNLFFNLWNQTQEVSTRISRIFVKISWLLPDTLCFWSHGFSFLCTVIGWVYWFVSSTEKK